MSEMAEPVEMTEAELRERYARRRAALRLEPGPGGSGATSSADVEMAVLISVCPSCGQRGEIPVPAMFRHLGERKAVCSTCRAAGEAKEAQLRAEEDARLHRERWEQRGAEILDVLRSIGVNAWDHRDATLQSFDPREAGPGVMQAAREFLAEVRTAVEYEQVRGLYLFGGTGAGKSHLAVAIARALLLDPDVPAGDVVYDHALRLIGQIQRTYGSDERAEEVLQRRIDARLWILDDLGTEAPSADVVRRLTEIFTERAMRPTIVTSNLAPDQLEERNPEFFRVVSRLGPRYFRTVRVHGSDRRFAAA